MWTAIVVTCASPSHVIPIQSELELLQKKGIINKETIVLTVEDPGKKIGSGSATINALLVIAEHLSVKHNYQVVTADVIQNARILIFHHGRNYPFDPHGKAFLTLPIQFQSEKKFNQNPVHLKSNFENLLSLVTELSSSASPGVWVCSTDMLLRGKIDSTWVQPENCDVVLFSTLEDISYATNHGAIQLTNNNSVENILYMSSSENLEKISIGNEKVALVAGLVYFSVKVAESLLSLHTIAPVDSCTYLGLDSGASPLQISLYFDILTTMATGVTEDSYVSGDNCKSYNLKHGYDEALLISTQHVRRLVWNELHSYKMKAHILNNIQHEYWSEFNSAAHHASILFGYAKRLDIHSSTHFVEQSTVEPSLIVNSYLKHCKLGPNSVIQHCNLQGTTTTPIETGNNSYLIGVHSTEAFVLKDRMALMETSSFLNSNNPTRIKVIFGVDDLLNLRFTLCNATFCNIPWQQFFSLVDITPSELWPDLHEKNLSLMTARLFPKSDNIQNILWMQNADSASATQIEEWKRSERFSLSHIISNIALTQNFQVRDQIFRLVTRELITSTLVNNLTCSLLPYFDCAVIENWSLSLLNLLDTVPTKFHPEPWEPGKTARTLACMADLLGCMAGKAGGLRSGPAANQSWLSAFNLLETGTRTSVAEGFEELSIERENWLDTPTKLIRAARHYEGAAQILIRHAVTSAKQYVQLEPSSIPPIGQWTVAECPARVDLQGGWSDTPPICYELGGSVLNVALLVHGKKPIGARARLIAEPQIELLLGRHVDSKSGIVVRDLQNLRDYRQLSAAGALLKAAIICAKVIDFNSNKSLQTQLINKYGGGIQIQTWSHLPEGSGLGTSSILAAAILAVLWSVTGQSWTHSALIHAVLYVEQLLTTGGGWQDQVAGVNGGVSFAHSRVDLPLEVKTECVHLNEVFRENFNQHLVLSYTGKVRLAKNLLQNVIRNWYARDSETVKCFENLVENARLCKLAFEEENLEKIGQLMNQYWKQKLIIAPGCDPAIVNLMMTKIEPLVYGQTLAGAGGGGFIVMLTKQPNIHAEIERILQSIESKVIVYPAVIDTTGITITAEI